MAELTFFSPAKINLFLHITGRRDDGYHDLQSVFRALDFGDTLTFRPKTGGDLITLLGDNLPCEQQDNLIVKAAHLLAKKFPAYASSVSVILDKVIPVGGGLGGGSSNCAMTLIALNQLWGLHLTPKLEQLWEQMCPLLFLRMLIKPMQSPWGLAMNLPPLIYHLESIYCYFLMNLSIQQNYFQIKI